MLAYHSLSKVLVFNILTWAEDKAISALWHTSLKSIDKFTRYALTVNYCPTHEPHFSPKAIMSSLPDRPPPSTAAIVLATAILCALGGYFIGQGASLGLFSRRAGGGKKSWPNSYDVTIHPDSSDEELIKSLRGEGVDSNMEDESSESDSEPEELSSFEGNQEECKLVLAVRTDLGMTKGKSPLHTPFSHRHLSQPIPTLTFSVLTGKIAAQCSHATLACYKHFLSYAPQSPILRRWETLGQAKIAVQVKSEEELETLHALALSLGLCAQVVQDAGRTQIASGSRTVLGVGPGPRSVVDQVTGQLKLL